MLVKSIITAMLLGAATTIGSIAAKQGIEALSKSVNDNSAKMKDVIDNIKNAFKAVKLPEKIEL